jgi:16S rRNA pseudouridine516 synthase
MAVMMRLDKFLCEMGVGTRSEVKAYLKKGQVTVGGEIVKKPETKINENEDEICFLGQVLNYEAVQYFLLNKPAGCVTATKDNLSETVMSFLPDNRREDLFPVGRLDKDTTGLLLLTNDGDFSHRLMSPKKHVAKTYEAVLQSAVRTEDIDVFAKGLEYGEEEPAKPAKLEILSNEEPYKARLTITEGKFHQVKRMFHAVGNEVLALNRVSIGNLVLDSELKQGEYRDLTLEEVESLKNFGGFDV